MTDDNPKFIKQVISAYGNSEVLYSRMFNVIPPPVSSGELALINLFSALYSALAERNTCDNILLIIDEIDAFLHPKWQQDILTHITKWINESTDFSDKKVQLVVATHSPILLSDLQSERVIYIDRLCKVNKEANKNQTFGTSINNLFYDSFFMEDGSIGAIARDKINKAIDVITKESDDIDQETIAESLYTIDRIGDRFIKERLKSYRRYKVEEAKRQGNR